MKLNLILSIVLFTIIAGCSKDNEPARNPAPTKPKQLHEYKIDLTGYITDCEIYSEWDEYAAVYFTSFRFYASPAIPFPVNTDIKTNIQAFHSYVDTADNNSLYFSIAEESDLNNYFIVRPVSPKPDFFNLPYNDKATEFSGKAFATNGTGRYKGITSKDSLLNFSGSLDTLKKKGTIRIQGTVFF